MDLHLPTKGLYRYKSASQRATVGTESWGATNFFCPSCESPRLSSAAQGTAAIDYFSPSCDSPFQPKKHAKPLGTSITAHPSSDPNPTIPQHTSPNPSPFHSP